VSAVAASVLGTIGGNPGASWEEARAYSMKNSIKTVGTSRCMASACIEPFCGADVYIGQHPVSKEQLPQQRDCHNRSTVLIALGTTEVHAMPLLAAKDPRAAKSQLCASACLTVLMLFLPQDHTWGFFVDEVPHIMYTRDNAASSGFLCTLQMNYN
jgi:hypothetical protein